MQDVPYSYLDAGYNRFFTRSIGGNISATTLSNVSVNTGSQRSLNFDQLQVSGSLGDTLRIGRIFLDGRGGRISVNDAANNEVVRIGNLN